MSLVAGYDSDSDEEENDSGETFQKSSNISEKVDEPEIEEAVNIIEDEDEWETVKTTVETTDSISEVKSNLFSLLPQPKDSTLIVAEELDDEFISKKPLTSTTTSDKKPTDTNLQAQSKGKKKQPVKIMIPTLKGVDSDSDDESLPPQNAQTNKKRSTLFSMLPKPRHSVTVCENKNRVFEKEKNRSFVPHTLTKKKKDNEKKKQTQTNKLSVEKDEDDDEDDDMSGNFFSLTSSTEDKISDTNTDIDVIDTSKALKVEEGDTTKDKHVVPPSKGNDYFASLFQSNVGQNREESKVIENASSVSIKTKQNSEMSNLADRTPSDQDKKTNSDVTAPYIGATENLAKPYASVNKPHSNVTQPYGNVNEPYSEVTAPYGNNTKPYGNVKEPYSEVTAPYGSVTKPYGNVTEPYSEVTAPYGSVAKPYVNATEPYSEVTEPYANVIPSHLNTIKSQHSEGERDGNFFSYAYKEKEEQAKSEIDYYNQPNEDHSLDDKALTALLGRKRILREEVNIIDINAADIQGNNQEHLKNLSKQSSYRSKKPKSSQPHRQSRSKHQITYLAYQARERELELQESWAQSRQTRRQTQSKYGF